jgi:hypothetical protein
MIVCYVVFPRTSFSRYLRAAARTAKVPTIEKKYFIMAFRRAIFKQKIHKDKCEVEFFAELCPNP